MSYGSDELKSFDEAASKNSQFIASVRGKDLSKTKKSGKFKKFSAVGFVLGVVGIFVFTTISGQEIPALIHDALIRNFDTQHTDMVESMKIIYQQSLRSGEGLPEKTITALKEKGVLVGYLDDGNFIEANKHNGGLVLQFKDKIITADEFIAATESEDFFDALESSSPAFSQSMGYYDDSAREVFKKIGTNRNNYTGSSYFNEVMKSKLNEGSDIGVNSVSLVRKTRKNEHGEIEVYYEYEENGTSATSKNSAAEFIDGVREKNPANNQTDSALYSAYTLSVADMISMENQANLFYALFMEIVSKMKAGEGNESKVHEAMNFLYEPYTMKVVDTNTAEVVEVTGSALEEPSLYAVLSGDEITAEDVKNFSSERVLKTIENQIGTNDGRKAISETIVSTSKKKGTIGRFISSGIEKASEALLNLVEPTLSSSLANNSYDEIKGFRAGKMLVNGAINVSGMLAKQSGATSGDAKAINEYAVLNAKTLAMEAKIDRMNRSPFDITSKNTFLGSIVYNLAVNTKYFGSGILSGFSNVINLTKQAAISLMPSTYADSTSSYLNSFGDCERFKRIGAEGTVECLEVTTFDTSTLNDPYNDPGFISFVENNTILSNGVRTVKPGSVLAGFIQYNNLRDTPVGVTDGGILESLKNNSSSISFVSNILSMVETYLDSSEAEQKIASGAAFVNSSDNKDWQTVYRYAQRYVSLARAAADLRKYAGDSTAYNNILFFEGEQNPVAVFTNEYYALND